MEIIVFAVLAGYLFFRLWSVLGTRTGNEKPLNPLGQARFEEGEKDNVIVIPKQFGKASSTEESDSKVDVQVSQLKKVMPDFDVGSFIRGSENAFGLIIKAYSEGNENLLKQLLEETVYDQFYTAIQDRQQKGLRQETEVDSIQAELVSIDVVDKKAQITVRFKSDQMIATFNQVGENIDNPARIRVPVTDLWTFEKPIKAKTPTWLLIRTSVDTI
ncbi:Tim44/TimA family putative adaptor protein [Candidatus Finniella inopinata]|uniref:Tim44-like domain-containing protein n=1 Tax=Candidatus Finniella inopinata TaxID=1696036 RepID=A0A4Q7DJL3_9PROT|nr:Tim44/TimA family putative adaptor protein [Candidatus Finniella inopinata]RZI46540.1 hypothetical protein EQU50_02840 [Candidatus Finniella inopinata]